MAAKYRKISPAIWNDGNFKAFSDTGKLVFFMLLTHPHTSAIGTLRAFLPGLAPELGWPEEVFREAFREAFAKGMVKVDEKAGLIWLPNFLKHNPPESPNVVKSWISSYEECPECGLKKEVLQIVKSFSRGLGEAFTQAFMEAFAKALPNQEQEQEQDPDTDPADQSPMENPADESGRQKVKGKMPNCPHTLLVDLYHEILPELPRVKIWEGQRRQSLASRWRQVFSRQKFTTVEQGIEYFRRLFIHVRASPFLMGQTAKPFVCSLEWMARAGNYAKIIENRYHEKAQ
jgi:hypothetical protein